MESWTITRLLDWTTDFFKKYSIEWPHLEAEILLAHALKLKRIELYTRHEQVVNQDQLALFKGLIERRIKREPIAYITGNQPFMSIEFKVDKSVLIPRPETEQLVEIAIGILGPATGDGRLATVADIGTGSGAIAITLAKYLPDIKVIAIDSSPAAIEVAQKNAELNQVAKKINFMVGNLFEPLQSNLFDLILSNPPYIPTLEIEKLDPDVRLWEPREALDGGEDGLKYVRTLIKSAPDYLNPGGCILIEIGFDQGEAVKLLAENSGNFSEIKIIRDINGKDRILKATRR